MTRPHAAYAVSIKIFTVSKRGDTVGIIVITMRVLINNHHVTKCLSSATGHLDTDSVKLCKTVLWHTIECTRLNFYETLSRLCPYTILILEDYHFILRGVEAGSSWK